jgi:hypothetical protein
MLSPQSGRQQNGAMMIDEGAILGGDKNPTHDGIRCRLLRGLK